MSIPIRNADQSHVIASDRTFFVTSSTWGKQALVQSTRVVSLLIDVLYHYRRQHKYLLHEFVVMPDHFHVLITVGAGMTIKKAAQLIKGGFAFRAGRELGFHAPVWQKGFSEVRVNERVYARVHSCESSEAFPGDRRCGLSLFVCMSRIRLGPSAAAPKGASPGRCFRHR